MNVDGSQFDAAAQARGTLDTLAARAESVSGGDAETVRRSSAGSAAWRCATWPPPRRTSTMHRPVLLRRR